MTDLIKEAPRAAATALGAGGYGLGATVPTLFYHPPQPPRKLLVVRAIGPEGQPFTVIGQVAKVMLALLDVGEGGVTPLARETWALRLSDHVRKLKIQHGLSIVRLWGTHDDGRHAVYVLRSTVTVLEIISD